MFEECSKEEFNKKGKIFQEFEIEELPSGYSNLMDLATNILVERASDKYNKIVVDCIKEIKEVYGTTISVEFFKYWILSNKFDHHTAVNNTNTNFGSFNTKKECRKLKKILKAFKIKLNTHIMRSKEGTKVLRMINI